MAKRNRKADSESSDFPDYVGRAVSYAKGAISDKSNRQHGKLIQSAASRFLDDLRRSKKKGCPFYFSASHANHACWVIEGLPHVEGRWSTDTISLDDSQIFFVVQLFGFRVESGRRFTSALYSTARKSGKSTLAAAILLYCECFENEPGAQIISAATTFPQANIIFNIAKQMVEKTPDLRRDRMLEVYSKAIVRMDNASSFKPIHSKASTQDGLNPSHIGLDEIHAHKTNDLINVLTSAAGARGNPLWLYTTTEGYISGGPWSELRLFARQILSGVFGESTDHFLVIIFTVDDDDQDFDESCWIKANPLIRSNPHLMRAIQREATEAKAMPGKLAEFRIKRLNRQSATAKGWIVYPKWKACGGAVDLEFLTPYPCWGGLDLASTTDLCSFRLVWLVEGVWYTWGRRWVPSEAVASRTERGTVPYASWIESGHLEMIPGPRIDQTVIVQALIDANERFNLQMVGYDQWNAAQVISDLTEAEVPTQIFIQGPKSYHPAMKAFEGAYLSGNLRHGNDPVLTWCASNLVVRYDVNLNMAPDKKRSADKIDDLVALFMAMGIAIGVQPEKSPYEERGIRVIDFNKEKETRIDG